MNISNPSAYLTFAGAIPFIMGAIFISMGIIDIPVLGATVTVLSVYGLVIASFMAGAHWGNHLGLRDDQHWVRTLPIVSNIIALGLWLGFLTLSSSGFMWLLIVAFLIMVIIDYGLYRAQLISANYFKIRQYVTAIVVISLGVAAIFI